VTDAPKNQDEKILWTLQAAWPGWVQAPELARISLQYSARIFSLRRKGWVIANKIEFANGVKRGFFRLGPKPVPRNAELRRSVPPPPATPPPVGSESLFGDLAPDRTYRE
jgi:hypothetical protein